VVEKSDQMEGDNFGNDNEGHLVYEQAGANSHQGSVNTAYPDLYRKTVAVENECAKNNFNEKEDWSGKRTKKFEIDGCIKIVESQCGGLCEKKNSCENGTGKKVAKSLSRLGDAEAEVDKVCSCSGKPTSDCCHKKCYPKKDFPKKDFPKKDYFSGSKRDLEFEDHGESYGSRPTEETAPEEVAQEAPVAMEDLSGGDGLSGLEGTTSARPQV
jgi:hypothetical protein